MKPAEAPLDPQTRRNLRCIMLDGLVCALMMALGEFYLQAFALAVNVGPVGAGLIATVPLLLGAALQLISPWGVRALRSYRRWVIVSVAIQATSFLPLIAAALVGTIATPLLFAITAVYWGAGLAATPAWSTWVGTLVPTSIRADYFARRSRLTQIGLLAGFVAGGSFLHWARAAQAELTAFAALFALAAAFRYSSVLFLVRQTEPEPPAATQRNVTFVELGRRLGDRRDARLLLYMFATQLATYIAGPYFAPFMLNELRLDYRQFAILIATIYAAKSIALPLLGRFCEHYGVMRLLWLAGFGIIPLSALWTLNQNFWYLLVLQAWSGVAWGAYELATFLMFFEALDNDERTSLLTKLNLLNAAAMCAGSFIGAALLWNWQIPFQGYLCIFIVSAIARIGVLLLLRRVAQAPERPAAPSVLRAASA